MTIKMVQEWGRSEQKINKLKLRLPQGPGIKGENASVKVHVILSILDRSSGPEKRFQESEV